jgi:hypothetical protein
MGNASGTGSAFKPGKLRERLDSAGSFVNGATRRMLQKQFLYKGSFIQKHHLDGWNSIRTLTQTDAN